MATTARLAFLAQEMLVDDDDDGRARRKDSMRTQLFQKVVKSAVQLLRGRKRTYDKTPNIVTRVKRTDGDARRRQASMDFPAPSKKWAKLGRLWG